jgi:alpha-ketoglutarate-dependent taurine dioxygenase
MSIRIEPIKPALGANIHVDKAKLTDDAVVQDVLKALDKYDVLVFPKIGLTDEEQLAFTNKLGVRSLFADKTHTSSHSTPGIYKVTLDPTINAHPEYVLGTFFWHMDGMPVEDDTPPPKASLLSARKTAPKGGQTEFASTAAAYDALSAEEKADIDKLRVVHTVYHAVLPTLDTEEDHHRQRKDSRQRERPLVWTNKAGRRSMIIGHTADRIVGKSVSEGRALLERLMEWSAQPDFKYRHYWQEGDFVIWNNVGVLHRVIPYDTNSGRMMHRTSLAGLEAVA